jgi:hypothetical protein
MLPGSGHLLFGQTRRIGEFLRAGIPLPGADRADS